MNVFISIILGEQETMALKEGAHNVHLTFGENLAESERKKQFLEADIAFGNVPALWLSDASRLQWLQLESVGFGEYQTVETSKDVKITNLRGMFSIPVAETAVGGILSLYRGLDTLARLKDQRQWLKNEMRPSLRTLHGAKAIIVGGGSIGEVIKERLQAFGTNIQVMDKYSTAADITALEVLDQQLPETDVVMVCLPETQETIGFFDRERLSLLSPHAVFVNVGRGSAVDESALIDKLNAKEIAGCVLDVTHEEPLPEYHPIWNCPNTIITQHTSGGSGDELLNKVKVFLTNLKRFQQGQPLENIVDLKRGY